MAANELFSSGSVSITPHIARFKEVSYQIVNIGSVRVLREKKHHIVMKLLMVVTAGAALVAYNYKDTDLDVGATAVYVAVVTFVAAIAWQVIWPRIEYILVLKTSSGDVQAYRTGDREHILEVKHAIEEAFGRRS
jgi:hypothetical protein